jgi:hypothetical protein
LQAGASAAAALAGGAPPGAVVDAGLAVLASLAAAGAGAAGGAGGVSGGALATTVMGVASGLIANASALSARAASAALQVLAEGNAASAGASPDGGVALLSSIANAALAGTPPNAAATVSSSSLLASASRLSPNCAPAVSLTVVRVPVGSISAARAGNWTISLTSPLPFCNATVPLPEVGDKAPMRLLTLPPALISAQPPPALTLSYATLAWLTRAGGPVAAVGAASVDFRLVQWGAAPMTETAGTGGIAYPPAQESSAAVDSGGGGVGSRRRALGLFSSFVAFFSPSSWASMVSSAFSATRIQLNAAAPPPSSRADRLPSRPLDSRVFTVEVSSGGGPPVALNSIPGGPPGGLFYITVPLRDLSIVSWRGGGVVGVDVGQGLLPPSPVFNVTCPRGALAGETLPALDVSASSPRTALGKVTVLRVSTVEYGAPAILVEAPGEGAAAAGDLAGAPAAAGSAPEYGGAATPADGGPTASSPLYVLSADCGPTYGRRPFACGPGMGGTTVSFACPRAAPEPTCLYYDKPSKQWSTAGCSVARVDVTSILCACDALRDFGTRYAALDNAPANVFVTGAPSVGAALTPAAAALFAAVAVLLGGVWCAGCSCSGGDRRAERAFAGAMRADVEARALEAVGWGDLLEGVEGGPLGGVNEGVKALPAPPALRVVEEALAAVDAAQAPSSPPPGARLGTVAAAAAERLSRACATAPPAPPPLPLPPATLLAIAARHLASGALGALSAASPPPLCAPARLFRPAAFSSARGGLLAAALFHGLLLTLAVTAGLYARVFAAPAARGPSVVSFSPPLAPLSGGRFAALVFFSAAVGGVCVALLHEALLGTAARAHFFARFPRLAGELYTRAAFSAGMEAAGGGRRAWALIARAGGGALQLPLPYGFETEHAFAGWLMGVWGFRWAARSGGAAVAPFPAPLTAAPPAGFTTPRTLLARLESIAARWRRRRALRARRAAAAVFGTLLPHLLSLFCAYYTVAFGLRNGAEAGGALLGAWAAGVAVWVCALQPLASLAAAAAPPLLPLLLPPWALPPAPSAALSRLAAVAAPRAAAAAAGAHPVVALLEAPLPGAPPLRALLGAPAGDGQAAAALLWALRVEAQQRGGVEWVKGGAAATQLDSSGSGASDPLPDGGGSAPLTPATRSTPAPAPPSPPSSPPKPRTPLRSPSAPLPSRMPTPAFHSPPAATPRLLMRPRWPPPPRFANSAAADAAALLSRPPPRGFPLPLAPAPAALHNAARLWEARVRFLGAGAAVVGTARPRLTPVARPSL